MSIEKRSKDLWAYGQDEWWWPKLDIGAWNSIRSQHDLPQRIMQHVKTFDVCINAGAHAGYYTKQYAKNFRMVYAVEPQPENFLCLVRNIEEQNVFKIQACLSNTPHLVSIYSNEISNTGGFHITPGDNVPCITIDSLPGHIDLIHLDVEGHEYEVLVGAKKKIEESSPVIALETIPNYNTKQAEKFLFDLGYVIAEIVYAPHNPSEPHDTIYVREQ